MGHIEVVAVEIGDASRRGGQCPQGQVGELFFRLYPDHGTMRIHRIERDIGSLEFLRHARPTGNRYAIQIKFFRPGKAATCPAMSSISRRSAAGLSISGLTSIAGFHFRSVRSSDSRCWVNSRTTQKKSNVLRYDAAKGFRFPPNYDFHKD